MKPEETIRARLLSKVQYADSGCWMWTGCTVRGYGQMRLKGQRIYTHRASYMIFKGSIPEGMVIDHLCRTPECINPNHLEAVTNKENLLRGEAPTIKIHRLGYCARGHEINNMNTYINPKTGWIQHCRICERENQRKRR